MSKMSALARSFRNFATIIYLVAGKLDLSLSTHAI